METLLTSTAELNDMRNGPRVSSQEISGLREENRSIKEGNIEKMRRLKM